jgi:hypothetical protein
MSSTIIAKETIMIVLTTKTLTATTTKTTYFINPLTIMTAKIIKTNGKKWRKCTPSLTFLRINIKIWLCSLIKTSLISPTKNYKTHSQ